MQRRRWLLFVLMVLLLAAIGCDEFGHSGGGPSQVNTPDKSFIVEEYPVSYQGTGTITKYFQGGTMECAREAEATFTAKADHTCELRLVSPAMVLVPGSGGATYACGTGDYREVWSMQGTVDLALQACLFTTCNGTTNYRAEGRLGFGPEGTVPARDLVCVVVKSGEDDARLVVPSMPVVK